jgi:hypothetical protein
MNQRASWQFLSLLHCTLLTAVVGCGESSGPSGPGQLHISLESSHADDAAAVLELSGSGLGAVEVPGGEAFLQREDNVIRVVVILDDPGKIAFSIDVDDISQRPTVRILEVADGNNRLRDSVADYETTLQPLAAIAQSGRG